jgi:hypothetical protein
VPARSGGERERQRAGDRGRDREGTPNVKHADARGASAGLGSAVGALSGASLRRNLAVPGVAGLAVSLTGHRAKSSTTRQDAIGEAEASPSPRALDVGRRHQERAVVVTPERVRRRGSRRRIDPLLLELAARDGGEALVVGGLDREADQRWACAARFAPSSASRSGFGTAD